MSYWLISVPTEKKSESGTRKRLQDGASFYANIHDFKIPNLKVGTLDSLMSLSDKLQKVDTIVEGIAKKIERAYYDVSKADPTLKLDKKEGAKAPDISDLKVETKLPPKYVEEFKWNSDRYKVRVDLNQLSDGILEYASKQDDYLKKALTEFNEQKVALTNIERRETGTLLVKPLGQFITKLQPQHKSDLVRRPSKRQLKFMWTHPKSKSRLRYQKPVNPFPILPRSLHRLKFRAVQ